MLQNYFKESNFNKNIVADTSIICIYYLAFTKVTIGKRVLSISQLFHLPKKKKSTSKSLPLTYNLFMSHSSPIETIMEHQQKKNQFCHRMGIEDT